MVFIQQPSYNHHPTTIGLLTMATTHQPPANHGRCSQPGGPPDEWRDGIEESRNSVVWAPAVERLMAAGDGDLTCVDMWVCAEIR